MTIYLEMQNSDGEWQEIGQDQIFTDRSINIKHGNASWSGGSSPSSCSFSLDNTDNAWSLDDLVNRNEFARRNTPIRVGMSHEPYLYRLPPSGTACSVASSPNVTGKFDIRADIELERDVAPELDTRPGLWVAFGGSTIASKLATGPTTGWRLEMHGNNFSTSAGDLDFTLYWASPYSFYSLSDVLPDGLPARFMGERFTLRVVVDHSASTIQWYTGDSVDATDWTLWATDTGGPSGPHTANTKDISFLSDLMPFPGQLYAAKLYDGASVVMDVDFTGLTPGTTSFTGDDGLTYTVGSSGQIKDANWRFCGEISSIANEWTMSGSKQIANVEAYGVMRRLKQADPLHSCARRTNEQYDDCVAYWPMEEKGNTSLSTFGAAIGGLPMRKFGTNSSAPAVYNGLVASDAIPTFATDTWQGWVPNYGVGLSSWTAGFLFNVGTNSGDDVSLFDVSCSSGLTWRIQSNNTLNAYRVQVLNLNGTAIHTSSYAAYPERKGLFGLQGITSGANVSYQLIYITEDGTDYGLSGTVTGQSVGVVSSVVVNPLGDANDISMGHVFVHKRFQNFLHYIVEAYAGETAIERVRRLCAEEDISMRVYGSASSSIPMGPQGIKTLYGLLQECADTEQSLLSDSKTSVGLHYRSFDTLHNQVPVSLDYEDAEIYGLPKVIRDDNGYANDIEIVNANGSTARAQFTQGGDQLYLFDDPDRGISRYKKRFDINVSDVDTLNSHASTRLLVHGFEAPRIDSLSVSPQTENSDLGTILGLSLGDCVEIWNLPSVTYPQNQLIKGYSEVIGDTVHRVKMNTVSGRPWISNIIEDEEFIARYDSVDTELDADVTAGDGTIDIYSSGNILWTTDDDDYPIMLDINGIRVNATSCSGASNPQTMTVQAWTVLTDLPSGAKVKLADPTYYSL